ncbi:MAG: diguanylate cyclase [Rhodanobacteraceae bacterium]|nr:diguanylate cyclase [Rhodanobacteraceae bacterium]
MSSPKQGGAHILIVDDEPANIEVLINALPDYELSFATDGARALELAIERPFDLILLDVVMPGIGGHEVLRWLKSEPRTEHVPVIFVTSLAEYEDEARGLSLGAVDYITKPIRPAIVRARVATHLALKRYVDLLAEHLPTDALTGIPNARRFDQELERAWGRAQRYSLPLAIAQVNLDNFDRYTDFYGSSPADECLTRVARTLDESFGRGGDFAARRGASEFALLIEGIDSLAQARRILQAVNALEIPHVRSSSSAFVSASIGMVSLVPGDAHTPAGCMALAAELARAAFDGGGNRAEYQDLGAGTRSTVLPEEPTN